MGELSEAAQFLAAFRQGQPWLFAALLAHVFRCSLQNVFVVCELRGHTAFCTAY